MTPPSGPTDEHLLICEKSCFEQGSDYHAWLLNVTAKFCPDCGGKLKHIDLTDKALGVTP